MFSTILKEVTGYFDRRALISAFFPNLVFWGLTVAIVSIKKIGWDAGIEKWGKLDLTTQGLLLLAFFVWVAFCTFLTINLHSGLVRLCEGYWPTKGVGAWLTTRRRAHWQSAWDRLDRCDSELETQQNALLAERSAYEDLHTPAIIAKLPTVAEGADLLDEQIDGFLLTLNRRLKELEAGPTPLEAIRNLGSDVRARWRQVRPYVEKDSDHAGSPWLGRLEQLEQAMTMLSSRVECLLSQAEKARLRVNHDLFLLFPMQREDVMPTRLGNVLKAAEMHAQERYHLDSVLIWSRLQPSLPKEFSEPLQDAKTSLDLMVTLTTGILLFGLSGTAWLATTSAGLLVWWWPLILVGLSFVFRFWFAGGLSLLASALAFPLLAPILAKLPLASPWATAVLRAPMILFALSVVCFLAELCYRNAVEAGLAYGEKIKTAFDLYRNKALEGLGLQLPPTFDEERKVWAEVSGLLYRAYAPDERYYRYAKQDTTKEPVVAPPSETVPSPRQDLSAYLPITEGDIIETAVPLSELPLDVVRQKDDLVGKCPLQPLLAGHAVTKRLLVKPDQLSSTIAVGIDATPELTLGGTLEAGNLVDLILMPQASGDSPPKPIVFEGVLVLDVKTILQKTADANDESAKSVIVVAFPIAQRLDFVAQRAHATLTVMRRL